MTGSPMPFKSEFEAKTIRDAIFFGNSTLERKFARNLVAPNPLGGWGER